MNTAIFTLIDQQMKLYIILETTQCHVFFYTESINFALSYQPFRISLSDPQELLETYMILFQLQPLPGNQPQED